MAIYKTDWFKYLKNFMIGVGASIVMIGALFKILSMEGGDVMLTAGLVTEAILFLVLGILPPEKTIIGRNYTQVWMTTMQGLLH